MTHQAARQNGQSPDETVMVCRAPENNDCGTHAALIAVECSFGQTVTNQRKAIFMTTAFFLSNSNPTGPTQQFEKIAIN